MTSVIPEPDDPEARRLRALASYRILDTPPEAAFNELASNRLKHGFPDGQAFEVRLHLCSELVSDLARKLPGQLHIGPGPGAVFEVSSLRNRTRTGEIERRTPAARPATEAE